ncbi:retromer subunit VPS17 [Ascoidea rubescens DSM 1968]|uniref:Vacuolar protein sorting-associated protein 17 n=1 Tax=Ascoidea rubescens DSM 1968 TaxID=1344418 RepID=A0A1D2VLM1_9ASCO|nr:vacuolar protein sorting-associated protein Vps17 [Ascoidea rubescens DSM 1968]ODV62518.1 vacuolar protein sorting-associated protein Vps17 [Ascoidea rubescens DSM 1968]
MASSIPYDPDDFDNNPFAEPQISILNNEANSPASSSQAPSTDSPNGPLNNSSIEQQNPPLASPSDQNEQQAQKAQNQTLDQPPGSKQPKLADNQQDNLKNRKSNLSLLPERRSKKYKIRLLITAIERVGRKDPIIKFDAYTNLPNFRGTSFKDIRRTHNELVKFFTYLNGANPECFVPAVPPSSTSSGIGSDENDVKVKQNLQEWFDRITSNPILIRNEEFIFFIESDFGYSPVNKGRPPATGLKRKTLKQLQPPYDEVTELAEFRPLIKQIYLNSQTLHHKLEKLSKARKTLGLYENELGNRIMELSSLEPTHPGMANMWQKFGKTIVVKGDIESVKATTEMASLGDGLNLIINDSYVIKEALTNRHLLMRELINAQANTKSKHAQAAKIRSRTEINPLKVDEALQQLTDATKFEEDLTIKIKRISGNMLIEKQQYLQHFDKSIKKYISEYTRKIIESERKTLAVFEKIRSDVRNVDENGGLSRLGREAYPRHKTVSVQSQGPEGDSWSGDRKTRAVVPGQNALQEDIKDFSKPNQVHRASTASTLDSEENTIDARNAASLLGGSTF